MAFTSKPALAQARRAALYLRVSTGRQAANDVSIPSQRNLTTKFCDSQGWDVTAEFIEPGASATDDRRPVFQRMLEEARSADRRFNVIVVHLDPGDHRAQVGLASLDVALVELFTHQF